MTKTTLKLISTTTTTTTTALLLCFCCFCCCCQAQVLEGNKLRLRDASEFIAFANAVNKGTDYAEVTVLMECDMDLSGQSSSMSGFSGVFDGQGHVISGLKLSGSQYTGLVGTSLKGATVQNLVMDDSCLFKPTNIWSEPYTSPIFAYCKAADRDCVVESVVNLGVMECSTAFVRHTYIGAAMGGCDATAQHACVVRNMMNYGQLYYHGASATKLFLGALVGFCKGGSSSATPACLFENVVNYGRVHYTDTLATELHLGGIVALAEKRVTIVNAAQFATVLTVNRKSDNYYYGPIVGYSNGGSADAGEGNSISRVLWSSDLGFTKYAGRDSTNTNDADVVTTFDRSTFAINPAAAAAPGRLVEFLNDYVTKYNQKLKQQQQQKIDGSNNGGSTSISISSSSSSSSAIIDDNYNGNGGLYSWVQVSFDTHGGSAVLPRALLLIPPQDARAYPFETPTKEGTEFAGWYTEDSLATPLNCTRLRAGRTVTLHAKWSHYFVTFDAAGGSDFSEHNIKAPFGTAFVLPAAEPTKEGCTFRGWVPRQTVSYNGTAYTVPNHDVTFAASWELNNYMVRLYTDDFNKTLYKEYELPYGTAVRFPRDSPQRAGYVMTGWTPATDPAYAPTASGDGYVVPSHDIAFVAKWASHTFTASFYLSKEASVNGTPLETQQHLAGEAILLSAVGVPTLEGHTFVAWEPADKSLEVDSTTGNYIMPTADVTFYALWAAVNYTVTFVDNATAQAMGSAEVPYGTPIPYPEVPSASGTTLYWHIEGGGAEAPKAMPAYNFTAYGVWDRTRYYYTVVPVPGAAASSSKVMHEGDPITAPDQEPTRLGYVFAGWREDAACQGANFSRTVMPAADLTVYGCWTPLPFVATMDPAYGGLPSTTVTLLCGAPFAVEEPRREGYTFEGWCEDADCIAPMFTETTMPPRNLTLFAAWSPAPYVLCISESGNIDNDGYSSSTTTTIGNDNSLSCMLVEFGAEVAAKCEIPRSLFRVGYEFMGWSLEPYHQQQLGSSLSDDILVDVETLRMPASNMTLYAVWDVIEYTVFFVPGEGNGAPVLRAYPYGAQLDYPVYVRDKYIQAGWYTSESFEQDTLFDKATMPAQNLLLHLRWRGNPHNVTFVTNGGNAMDPATVDYNTKVNFNKEYLPTKANTNFTGWFLDNKLTEMCKYKRMPDEDLTLYARWSAASVPGLSLAVMFLAVLFVLF